MILAKNFEESDEPKDSNENTISSKQEETFPDPDPPDKTNFKSNDEDKNSKKKR